jgi:hypothetical protein
LQPQLHLDGALTSNTGGQMISERQLRKLLAIKNIYFLLFFIAYSLLLLLIMITVIIIIITVIIIINAKF